MLTRRQFLTSTAALALAGSSFAGKKRPNVIFLFDDQLRANILSQNGGKNIATPSMDRMAAEGAVVRNSLSTYPLCTPFRGMLQTGRYPSHSGIILNWIEVNPKQRCLAHVFRDAGYVTGFIGKWHLAAGVRKYAGKHNVTADDKARIKKNQAEYLKKNPETEFVPPGPARLGYEHWEAFNFHVAFTKGFYYKDTPKRLFMSGYETDSETDLAIDFMKKHKDGDRPFFLVVAPHPPHPPFRPDMCPPGYLDKVPAKLEWAPNVPENQPLRKDPLVARCYLAMIQNVDDNIGRLLKFLDESGLSENTIFVLTADHGEQMGSHNRMNKMVPYAESVDVPLIVRWKKHIPAGTKTDVLWTPIDHLPTLCGLCGLKPPDTADGKDLSSSLLTGKNIDRDAVLMMNFVSDWDYFDSGTTWPEWRGVRTGRHTYVRWLAGDREELFDNRDDPYQLKDLASGQQDLPTLQKLRARLKDLLAEAHDEFLAGTRYADWYDDERNLVKTALGKI